MLVPKVCVKIGLSMWMCGCLCLFICIWSFEIDTTACFTSLTEESSGMETDHMPDALGLEKGIG